MIMLPDYQTYPASTYRVAIRIWDWKPSSRIPHPIRQNRTPAPMAPAVVVPVLDYALSIGIGLRYVGFVVDVVDAAAVATSSSS